MVTNANPTLQSGSDVLVIGGGPAGSTIASLLQDKGWRVVLLERNHHPRFHIGESLLPMNLPILARLGVLEQVRNIGVVKYGAEFNAADLGQKKQTIYFSHALDKSHPFAFQVRRAEFDHLLLKNSVSKGVVVHEGMRVNDVVFRPEATTLVHAVDEKGIAHSWETRFVVDASGRDTFLARKFNLKTKNRQHQSAAIFGHFRHVTRVPGKDVGNIGIYWFKYGWFWMIPLRDDVMSVGAVCWPEYLKTRLTSPEEFLWTTIKLCPTLWERMQNAELLGKVQATGNYSYRATRMYGDGYLLVGDAYAFIDPVFSTGVFLAMNSAVLGTEAVDAYLRDPNSAQPYFKRLSREIHRGIKIVSWFIYRFTSPAMQRLFAAPRNFFRMQEAIVSMLAGDLFRNTSLTLPLTLFKAIYYLTFAVNFPHDWASYRRRKYNAGLHLTLDNTNRNQL